MKPRIIYYYQTFSTLKSVLYQNTPLTHIHLSSIHFGVDNTNKPYIHLNDNDPYDKQFDFLWNELKVAVHYGIKIHLMIGGAGGGYSTLFSDFETYYAMLYKLIDQKSNVITGIDLDIEEYVSLDNVKKLIKRLKEDFGNNLSLSMAPIQSSLEYDESGLGGFCYKDLLQSQEGKMIEYFNGQFYGDYSLEAYDAVVKNGYLPEMVVMGCIAGNTDYNEIDKVITKYKNKFGGVFLWEYCYAKPSPGQWLRNINNILNINK